LAPVKVQGEGAAQEIAAAIELMNRLGGFDVLVVGRGGGSLEDLWCFNEEIVARAIVASQIPVISAVGHEIDFTISDFVADLRAPTPSAAAELVVGRKDAFEGTLEELNRRLIRSLREYGLGMRNRLQAAAGSYVFREPQNMVRQYYQHLDSLKLRIHHVAKGGLGEGHQRLDDFRVRMAHELRLRTQSSAQEIRRLDGQLKALNPLAVLTRGYSITRDEKGRIVRTAKDVTVGQRITTRLGQGTMESEVTAKHDDKEN
jgi:exodeoxyribonuclease VII large subunit